jgi:hypothetical protein
MAAAVPDGGGAPMRPSRFRLLLLRLAPAWCLAWP